jgi:spoIIIJ-associated protein
MEQEIRKIAEEFFKNTGFEVFISVSLSPQDGMVFINVKADEPKFLIGQDANVLLAAQKLLGNIVKHKTGQDLRIDLDINDYKKKKKEYLLESARSIADEVFLSKKEKILPPMPAYERRIIHMALAQRSDVITESRGEGEERQVAVMPK